MSTYTTGSSATSERRNYCKIVFILMWCVGMFTGISVALHNSSATFSLMRSLSGGVSIVCLLFSFAFPFVISAVIVSFGQQWLLVPIGFVRSFMYFFCACSVTLAYGSGGWLSRYILMFTDSIISVLLLWFWLKCIADQNHTTKRTIVCVLITGIVCAVDYCYISPLAVQIFNYS